MKINVDYIARVEGESSVNIELKAGKLEGLRLNIWEPPRFFEGFLVGRKYDEVPDIVSRICGICPVSHMTTAISALENAIGFEPSPEIKKARDIMVLSQIAASHLVHLCALVLPDYQGSAMLMGPEKEIKRFLRVKEAVNNVTAVLGGRALHPVSMVVGGFTKLPPRREVEGMITDLEEVTKDVLEIVKAVSALEYPTLVAEAEYVALCAGDAYALNGGMITSSSGTEFEIGKYHDFFREDEVPYSNAKRTILKGKSPVMVGALSRLSLKLETLHPEARRAALSNGFTGVKKSPFFNILAQAIEVVHCVWECIEILSTLSCEDSLLPVKPREGAGAAMTEAPRGLLYHEYTVSRLGIIEKANIVTPTVYNFVSLEENLKKLVNENIGKPAEELSLLCEMLVRAYDPCFSCSVH